MDGYYVHVIEPDEHVRARIDILCDNDAEAKRLAKRIVEDYAIELWQKKRRIERFEPQMMRD